MKRIGAAIEPTEAEAACVRMTGKTLDEWLAIWKRRRIHALRDRKLTGLKLYTLDDRENAMRFYDLEEDDFEAVMARAGGERVTVPEDLRDAEIVQLGADRAVRIIEEHQVKAKVSCPILCGLVMYRLRQSTLRRIAAESHTTDK